MTKELLLQLLPIVLLGIVIVLQLISLLRKPRGPRAEQIASSVKREMREELNDAKADVTASVKNLGDSNLHAMARIGELLRTSQQQSEQSQMAEINALDDKLNDQLTQMKQSLNLQLATNLDSLTALQEQFRVSVTSLLEQTDKDLNEEQTLLRRSVSERTESLEKRLNLQLEQIEHRMQLLEKKNDEKLELIRREISEELTRIREDTGKQLNEIRGTVDEKLQSTLEKRISESFKTVSEQLEQVYRGLGEMQTLAGDVGSLKQVLSGVKTRGILGEIQLGAILEEILSPEQYETNVATVPGSKECVEYAVRLPATDGTIYLPIDSKFPGDRYAALLDARADGDKAGAETAWKELETELRKEARDIRSKYVELPYTTNFGIMFLPFEGLYAEAVNHGLVERLQRECQVNIAGPSTMAALLNSLQMGFRTLAIQKRSGEVWELLGAVKTEFDKFEEMLKKMQTHLNQTAGDLEVLMGARTRAIQKKLSGVQQLSEEQAELLLRSDSRF